MRSETREMLLIQLGVGQIGGAVIATVQRMAPVWRARYGLALRYHVAADSSGFASLTSALEDYGRRLASLPGGIPATSWRDVLEQAIRAAGGPERVIVVDCAVGDGTTTLLLAARAAGAHVVLCNKDPLTRPYEQFQTLQGDGQHGSLHLSATVGAGLPITSAVAAATASGDTVHEMRAVASGTLGHLCASMSDGVAFSAALRRAIAAGYCEPDPRSDLSGRDVARKLVILARLAGHRAESSDIEIESLIPPGTEMWTRDTFLSSLPDWHDHLADRFAAARSSGEALRYVGTMTANGALNARLRMVAYDDPLALRSGPDNVFVLRTARYLEYPLVIAGPGAGVAVTAGAVVSDILRAAGVL
jgi:homoserine dehydrogenase